jgi:hypothetical protein
MKISSEEIGRKLFCMCMIIGEYYVNIYTCVDIFTSVICSFTTQFKSFNF